MKTTKTTLLSVGPILILACSLFVYLQSPQLFTQSPVSNEEIAQAKELTVNKFDKYNLDNKDKMLLEKLFVTIEINNDFTNATSDFLKSIIFYLILISLMQLFYIGYIKFKK